MRAIFSLVLCAALIFGARAWLGEQQQTVIAEASKPADIPEMKAAFEPPKELDLERAGKPIELSPEARRTIADFD